MFPLSRSWSIGLRQYPHGLSFRLCPLPVFRWGASRLRALILPWTAFMPVPPGLKPRARTIALKLPQLATALAKTSSLDVSFLIPYYNTTCLVQLGHVFLHSFLFFQSADSRILHGR